MNSAAGILLFALGVHLGAAEPARLDTAFIARKIDALRAEYRACTGDSTERTQSQLLAWKKRLGERTETQTYQKMLREFVMLHDGPIGRISPCAVFAWERQRQKALLQEEKHLTKEISHQADRAVDSLLIQQELSACPVSPFDFQNIPFGLSKKVFTRLLGERTNQNPTDSGDYIRVRQVQAGGLPCDARFYFDQEQRYCRYELTLSPAPARQLNPVVRPQARQLADFFVARLGPPDHAYRVGYFDIVPQRLSPLKRWRRGDYRAIVGLGAKDGSFFARAYVRKR
jgi:hypothetical protein